MKTERFMKHVINKTARNIVRTISKVLVSLIPNSVTPKFVFLNFKKFKIVKIEENKKYKISTKK